MRLLTICTLFGVGLAACAPPPRYLNADEVAAALPEAADSAACNDLEQQGEDVVLRGSRAPAPKPTGGTIEDGTYVLTSTTLHTKDQPEGGVLVAMGKITMVVSGSKSQVVRSTVNGRERRSTVEREANGIVATLHTVCTSPSTTAADDSAMVTYTATRSSLQFVTPGPAGTVVATYTKVPPTAAKLAARHP